MLKLLRGRKCMELPTLSVLHGNYFSLIQVLSALFYRNCGTIFIVLPEGSR